MINKLVDNKKQILFIELCGLLHDIGKLSKAFLEYRQKWQNNPNGWGNDPHEKKYLKNHEVFKNLVPTAFDKKINELGGYDFCEPDFSIRKAVNTHIKPNSGALITMMLKASDSVDAATDRNNPLWGAEQKDKIYRSNVFGYESNRIVDVEIQEKARQELYGFLNQRLKGYLTNFTFIDRKEIIERIKESFEIGLSDTTRPQNDTTLWEHSYAVASILKVLTVHNLLNDDNKIYDFKDVKFGILGIGWDGMRFLSYGQKIGDIIGRKNIIEKIKEKLRELIEYEYPVGNEIYADDDGIYFIVPSEVDSNYKDLWETIEKQIYIIAAERSCGELQPHIKLESETTTLTHIVKVINDLKKIRSHPFSYITKHFKFFQEAINRHWDGAVGKTICPICRLRPVEREDVNKKVCTICKERRTQDGKGNETLFIDEIIDDNRKAALIIARFGLDDWLNGNMVRSLFVTEAKGIEREIENLGNVKEFADKENLKKKKIQPCFEINYKRIVDDINSFGKTDEINVKMAKCIAFLYDKRNLLEDEKIDTADIFKKWCDIRDSVSKEIKNLNIVKIDILLYNILCAKTPTPSTVMDVWETTHEFFSNIAKNILKCLLFEKIRLRVTVEPLDKKDIINFGKRPLRAQAVHSGKQIEILFRNKNEIEIIGETYSDISSKEWKNTIIRITDKDSDLKDSQHRIIDCNQGDTFVPYRNITATPNLFMAIVPADRAIEITTLIYKKYIEQFGKVMGRLPLDIGNIFLGHKMPMFVVLDAGKRMVANFDRLAGDTERFILEKDITITPGNCNFVLKRSTNGFNKTLTCKLPYKLGNCDTDYHHPYLIVDTNKDLSSERSTFFKTIVGDVVHFTEIEKNDELCIYPNYYDFEFLDSNTRRHDINIGTQNRRKSTVADFRFKPFLLDELSQKIIHLWNELLQGKQLEGITGTKLRNLQSLWLTKYQEWKVDMADKSSDAYKIWIELITSSIRREFKQLDDEQYVLLLETIENGLFFDTLELYLSILKERIETTE